MTVKRRILDLLAHNQQAQNQRAQTPGLTDRELTEAMFGSDEQHQQVNTACRALAAAGQIERPVGADGLIHNVLTDPAQEKALPWTAEELAASVRAYLDMLASQQSGQPYTKRQVIQALQEGALAGRSRSSIEFRMRNVSAVLEGVGRPWLTGYAPARNVGAGLTQHLLALLADVDTTLPGVLGNLPSPPARPPAGQEQPAQRQRAATVYDRNREVVAGVLMRTGGKCEGCGQPAPFRTRGTPDEPGGRPFLEVHHVRPLAAGGADTPQNAVGLCPNCHREVHYGARAETLTGRLQTLLEGQFPS
jgi:5-methylcytosine-specific restriction protein A